MFGMPWVRRHRVNLRAWLRARASCAAVSWPPFWEQVPTDFVGVRVQSRVDIDAEAVEFPRAVEKVTVTGRIRHVRYPVRPHARGVFDGVEIGGRRVRRRILRGRGRSRVDQPRLATPGTGGASARSKQRRHGGKPKPDPRGTQTSSWWRPASLSDPRRARNSFPRSLCTPKGVASRLRQRAATSRKPISKEDASLVTWD
jgi:hypothetical protein